MMIYRQSWLPALEKINGFFFSINIIYYYFNNEIII